LKSFKGILVVGEKNIFNELSQIISIASQCNTLLDSMFKMGYKEAEVTAAMKSMQQLERQSDVIAFKTSEDITSGAISPNIIDSLLQCVQQADDIVDTYYYISRELDRMSIAYAAGFQEYHTDWDSVYENMVTLAETSLAKVKEALSTADLSKTLQLRKEIEALEEQGDDVKDKGFDRLYRVSAKLHFLEFYHYQELLHKCDDILDGCEDLSDLIVAVVTSILK
jgi:uncharacterized protein Yka (UPF0111/DUF47 family)